MALSPFARGSWSQTIFSIHFQSIFFSLVKKIAIYGSFSQKMNEILKVIENIIENDFLFWDVHLF